MAVKPAPRTPGHGGAVRIFNEVGFPPVLSTLSTATARWPRPCWWMRPTSTASVSPAPPRSASPSPRSRPTMKRPLLELGGKGACGCSRTRTSRSPSAASARPGPFTLDRSTPTRAVVHRSLFDQARDGWCRWQATKVGDTDRHQHHHRPGHFGAQRDRIEAYIPTASGTAASWSSAARARPTCPPATTGPHAHHR